MQVGGALGYSYARQIRYFFCKVGHFLYAYFLLWRPGKLISAFIPFFPFLPFFRDSGYLKRGWSTALLKLEFSSQSINFLEGHDARRRLNDSILFHREHAAFPHYGEEIVLRLPRQNCALELRRHFEGLEARYAPLRSAWTVRRRFYAMDMVERRDVFAVFIGQIGKLLIEHLFQRAFHFYL